MYTLPQRIKQDASENSIEPRKLIRYRGELPFALYVFTARYGVSRKGTVSQRRVRCLKEGYGASKKGTVPQRRVRCLKEGYGASKKGTVPQRIALCLEDCYCASKNGMVPQESKLVLLRFLGHAMPCSAWCF